MNTPPQSNQEADFFPAAPPPATAYARFDVFLSHHDADTPAVETIARALQARGLVPWLDAWEVAPESDRQAVVAAALRGARACAVCVGPRGGGSWSNLEVR